MPSGPIPKHTITEDRSPNLRSKSTHSQGDAKGVGGGMFDGKTGGQSAPKVSGKPQSYTCPNTGSFFNRGGKPTPL
jgi:hypothetical protein